MHGLSTIIAMNNRAAEKALAETETTRHCSFTGDEFQGVILHSAKQRSTAFLPAGEKSSDFLGAVRIVGTHLLGSFETLDELVENYFA